MRLALGKTRLWVLELGQQQCASGLVRLKAARGPGIVPQHRVFIKHTVCVIQANYSRPSFYEVFENPYSDVFIKSVFVNGNQTLTLRKM